MSPSRAAGLARPDAAAGQARRRAGRPAGARPGRHRRRRLGRRCAATSSARSTTSWRSSRRSRSAQLQAAGGFRLLTTCPPARAGPSSAGRTGAVRVRARRTPSGTLVVQLAPIAGRLDAGASRRWTLDRRDATAGAAVHRRLGRRRRRLAGRSPVAGPDGTGVLFAASTSTTVDSTRSASWSLIEVVGGVVVAAAARACSATSLVRRSLRPLVEVEETAEDDRRRRPVPAGARARPAHRGRPAVARRSTRCSARSRPRSATREASEAEATRVRGADAPVRRRRQPRAAHAADVDPRLRRAVPAGRGARPGRHRPRDAPDRGRGHPDGPARRGPAAARPARPAAPARTCSRSTC